MIRGAGTFGMPRILVESVPGSIIAPEAATFARSLVFQACPSHAKMSYYKLLPPTMYSPTSLSYPAQTAVMKDVKGRSPIS